MNRPQHLRFLADMNLSPLTVSALAEEGYEIVRVSTFLEATASDAAILEAARAEEMVIITQDLDFSTLLALNGYGSPSLVTLRLSDTDPNVVTGRLLQILPQIAQHLLSGCAVSIDENTIRIRKLPIE